MQKKPGIFGPDSDDENEPKMDGPDDDNLFFGIPAPKQASKL